MMALPAHACLEACSLSDVSPARTWTTTLTLELPSKPESGFGEDQYILHLVLLCPPQLPCADVADAVPKREETIVGRQDCQLAGETFPIDGSRDLWADPFKAVQVEPVFLRSS